MIAAREGLDLAGNDVLYHTDLLRLHAAGDAKSAQFGVDFGDIGYRTRINGGVVKTTGYRGKQLAHVRRAGGLLFHGAEQQLVIEPPVQTGLPGINIAYGVVVRHASANLKIQRLHERRLFNQQQHAFKEEFADGETTGDRQPGCHLHHPDSWPEPVSDIRREW